MVVLWILLVIAAIVYFGMYFMIMHEYFQLVDQLKPMPPLQAFRVALAWPILLIQDYFESCKAEKKWKQMLRKKYPTAYKERYGVDPREEE